MKITSFTPTRGDLSRAIRSLNSTQHFRRRNKAALKCSSFSSALARQGWQALARRLDLGFWARISQTYRAMKLLTPQEAAHCANTGARQQEVQLFIDSSPALDLQEFMHLLEAGAHSRHFPLARNALDIRLAEQQRTQNISINNSKDFQIGDNNTLLSS